ncbi:hypothetical protein [Pseudoalteromonas sp. ASV78]|uniref:hypothetical protein n=1 Tax=Pseudoalteromonas sp. ASV78 TaxID=3397851 RepID=UPI0039FCB6B1
MDWFFGFADVVTSATECTFIIAIVIFIVFSGRNANLRWLSILMAGFYCIDALAMKILSTLDLKPTYGWVVHVYNISANLFLVWLIYERPWLSHRIGAFINRYTQRLIVINTFFNWFSPAKYSIYFYRQENALAKTLKMACIAQAVMIMHYMLFSMGITSADGLLIESNINRYIIFQVGYAMLLVVHVVEIVIITYMTLQVVLDRLPTSSSTI